MRSFIFTLIYEATFYNISLILTLLIVVSFNSWVIIINPAILKKILTNYFWNFDWQKYQPDLETKSKQLKKLTKVFISFEDGSGCYKGS